MSKRINLTLLYGGKSGEHEVSLVSAASVLSHLDSARYHITPVGMDKDGQFFVNEYDELLNYPKGLPVRGQNAKPLASLLQDGRFALDADVVFPVAHGPLYEDGCLQGILELANVAYVGCDVLSSAMGMDKEIARRVACGDSLRSAKYKSLSSMASPFQLEQFCQDVIATFGWPLFIKPCNLGSSVGTHKANNLAELKYAISDAKRYDKVILVEEFIKGMEVELAVLENRSPSMPPRVSTAGEIRVHHADGFYSYTAKYLESNQTELIIPAPLSQATIARLQQEAAEIFTRLKCRGLARVDFFVDEAQDIIYFNEINTMPGFTSISMYPKLWDASGISYPELLDELVELALIHYKHRLQLVTHYN